MDCQTPQSCCMNICLTDDLLAEIFCRLPRLKSVIQCKCVCKQWLSLISQPEFIARYIHHKINSHCM
ncbi:hypothetical protein BVRB_8g200110 isoform A [Beta vulgaris subsp. vulgaris]|uniref:F-box domain-containing protein n=1 Tax=Beta vulgaris subsp. vulgaris TaxID=3555 RepID=A0A7G2RLY4_BETVV|nr:hypothetical protein BVRB_8g200110 isoform A [Beta vulgaris subsp. vulgaris]